MYKTLSAVDHVATITRVAIDLPNFARWFMYNFTIKTT